MAVLDEVVERAAQDGDNLYRVCALFPDVAQPDHLELERVLAAVVILVFEERLRARFAEALADFLRQRVDERDVGVSWCRRASRSACA